MKDCGSLQRAQKGRETCPFRALDGFNEIRLSALERMAGTTRLELATSAVTVSGLQVLSTTWKSTDGTASHWKYVIDNVIVYRDVYRASSDLSISFSKAPITHHRTGE